MRNLGKLSLLGGIALTIAGCNGGNGNILTQSGLNPKNFEAIYDGDSTSLYVLKNSKGMEVCVTNFGARIVSVSVPDRNGNMVDVVLGFDSIQSYFPENNKSDFGATIGQYANRINQGRFVLDGDTIKLPQNNFGHCLHGGTDMEARGWQYRVFKAQQLNDSTVSLTINTTDGGNGFPGNVTATVTYTLTGDNALDIAYKATTDKKTIINLTNHSYFNLSGDPSTAITDDVLWVNADAFTPVDSTFMTTGEIVTVENTPMDFRTPKKIADDIQSDYVQIKNGNGYDHNWVLNSKGDINVPAVKLVNAATGIALEVFTDEPGIQIYTGNFLDGSVTGKNGKVYNQRSAICLETQHYPDSPNKPQWPTVVLNPGETYNSHCIYKFSIEK